MAMAEMQRAVTLAEKRALDSVTTERIRMERLLLEAASVSGVTGAMNVVSSRKPEMNILDAAINKLVNLNNPNNLKLCAALCHSGCYLLNC